MLYPVFIDLIGKACVVIGGGRIAERRIKGLLDSNANITVVSPVLTETLSNLAYSKVICWREKTYEDSDLDNAFLVVAATNLPEVNERAATYGNDHNMLVCRTDDAGGGNYLTAASVQRGDLLIAVTTSGNSPTLNAVIKSQIESVYGLEWTTWTKLFGAIRETIQSAGDEQARRGVVEAILSDITVSQYIENGDLDQSKKAALKCI
jgi:precorrin-2 dehydrogenase/sirohydrochlorin ferrochelatase